MGLYGAPTGFQEFGFEPWCIWHSRVWLSGKTRWFRCVYSPFQPLKVIVPLCWAWRLGPGGLGALGLPFWCLAVPCRGFFRAFPVVGQWSLSSSCSRSSAVGPLFWAVPASSSWRWRICPLRSEWSVLRCSLASGIFVRLEWKTREGFLLTCYWQLWGLFRVLDPCCEGVPRELAMSCLSRGQK